MSSNYSTSLQVNNEEKIKAWQLVCLRGINLSCLFARECNVRFSGQGECHLPSEIVHCVRSKHFINGPEKPWDVNDASNAPWLIWVGWFKKKNVFVLIDLLCENWVSWATVVISWCQKLGISWCLQSKFGRGKGRAH